MRTLILMLSILSLASCGKTPKAETTVTPITGMTMTVPYRVLIGRALSPEQKQEVKTLLRQTFTEVDAVLNKWNPDSELSKLNRVGADQVVSISSQLSKALETTSAMVALSEGRFDPTVEPLARLWREHLDEELEPSKEAISSLLPSLGWNHVHSSPGKVWKDQANTQIDLSGIAKGICVDTITERLVAAGYADVYVEWGGEIRTAGRHPEGRAWTIYISRLDDTDPSHAVDYIELKDQAIATSGDYLQHWTVGDRTYTHIIDPKNGIPLMPGGNKIASVTVIAPTCALADALATALMLFPNAGEATTWLEKVQVHYPEINVWILTRKDPG